MKTCLFHMHILANYMQDFLIYMVPHLSLLYYTSLPLWTYIYLTKPVLNHGAILLKALGGGIRVLRTHISSLFSDLAVKAAK